VNEKEFDVSGIGNAIVDLQVEVSFEEFSNFKLEAGSMNLVDQDAFDSLHSNLGSKDLKISSGGSGANTCVALAALGNKVSYGCIVAEDEAGSSYEEELRFLGVHLYNQRIKEVNTGKSLLMITPDAERTMNTYLGVTSTFGPEHVDERIVSMSDWLYIEGYLFSTDTGRAAIAKAVKVAKENNVKIAVTCSDGFIVDFFRDDLISVCKQSDMVFANKNEALKLFSETSVENSLMKLKEITKVGVITLSDKGAIAASNNEEISVESFKVKAIDDTGAGDMFAAGFLNSYRKNNSLKEALLNGSYLASRVVSQFGARLEGDLKEVLNNKELTGRLT